MCKREVRQLGTPTEQAGTLASEVKSFSDEELLELAIARRQELEDAGEIAYAADNAPLDAPPAHTLVGKWVEVCWRYWAPVEGETAAGKPKRKQEKLWCEAEVVQVANGTEKESPRCRKLVKAGAVRLRWPADPEHGERESFAWYVLQEADYNPKKDRHMAWRLTAEQLQRDKQA